MKQKTLIRRYAQGLVNALADEAEYRRVRAELEGFTGLAESHATLRALLSNPFLGARKKKEIIREILEATGSDGKTIRLILLIMDRGRMDLLPDIGKAIPEIWNERQGVLTFEVSSVVPLSDVQKERLEVELRRIERKPVSLAFRIDPKLLGGLSLKKGNIVYDASIEGDLMKLKEIIREG